MIVRRWRREGLLFAPSGRAKIASHAQAPTVLPVRDDLWRIYYSGRDEKNRSSVFAIDVNPRANMRVIEVHEEPLLEPAPPGTFDHFGFGASCSIERTGGGVALYYTAITPRSDVPHELAIGLAYSEDGLHFERASVGPILSKGPFDPYFTSMPVVRACDGHFEMWYMSGTGWIAGDPRPEPIYDLRYTRSVDGVVWDLATASALRASNVGGVAIARPWIARDGAGDRLWFSVRGEAFRAASSAEAYRLWSAPLNDDRTVDWTRAAAEQFENPPAPGEWDDTMQAYPCVVAFDGGLVLFYNGNAFGRDGFGWARADG